MENNIILLIVIYVILYLLSYWAMNKSNKKKCDKFKEWTREADKFNEQLMAKNRELSAKVSENVNITLNYYRDITDGRITPYKISLKHFFKYKYEYLLININMHDKTVQQYIFMKEDIKTQKNLHFYYKDGKIIWVKTNKYFTKWQKQEIDLDVI